mmetsp:Transcript_9670/g.17813  ORF Transcript_9670/g.17813 Transcript_9670/m.17813 type:complete len:150 (-) Transcript_9670:403-852(-)
MTSRVLAEDAERLAKAKRCAEPLIKVLEGAIAGLDNATDLLDNYYDDGNRGAEKELFGEIRNLESKVAALTKHADVLAPLGQAAMVPVDLIDHLDREDKSNPEIYTRHKIDFVLEEKLRLDRMASDLKLFSGALSEGQDSSSDLKPPTA